jgi:hypothetical protein
MNVVSLQLIIPFRFDLEPGEIWDQKLSVISLTPKQARIEKHSFARLCTTGKKICQLVGAGNVYLSILYLHRLRRVIGTLYILPLIVYSGLKNQVYDMSTDDINEISMILCDAQGMCLLYMSF